MAVVMSLLESVKRREFEQGDGEKGRILGWFFPIKPPRLSVSL
jgi:hypothetical protein